MAEEIVPVERLEVQVMDQPDKKQKAIELRKERRAQKRDQLFFQGAEVVEAAVEGAFELELDPDFDPEHPEVREYLMPDGWVEQYGERAAKRRLRMAVEALKSNKDAPYALKMAMGIVQSAMKEREEELEKNQNIQNLHVNFINVEAPKFPTQKLEDED